MTAQVLMYSTAVCPYCVMAERLLKSKGVEEIDKVRVDLDPAVREEMMTKTGRRTVPQIYIGDTHVGGFDDLSALDRALVEDQLLLTSTRPLGSGYRNYIFRPPASANSVACRHAVIIELPITGGLLKWPIQDWIFDRNHARR